MTMLEALAEYERKTGYTVSGMHWSIAPADRRGDLAVGLELTLRSGDKVDVNERTPLFVDSLVETFSNWSAVEQAVEARTFAASLLGEAPSRYLDVTVNDVTMPGPNFAVSSPKAMRKRAKAERAKRQAAALTKLEKLRGDKKFGRPLRIIALAIERAARNGYCSTEINVQETFGGKESHGPVGSEVWSLLQEAGYKMDISGSSNYYNERWFIKFKKEK